MHKWPRSLPAGSSPTSARRTPTAYARRSTATPTATSWGSAARRSTPVHRPDGGRRWDGPGSARPPARLGEANGDELLHERLRQRTVDRKVQRALRHRVALKVVGKLPEDRPAERHVAQVILERGNPRDGLATHAERGNAVGDHLFRLR